MREKSNVTSDLFQKLEELSQDQRLARVFGERNCALWLWFLELDQGGSREYRLLFGWVIPHTFNDPQRWFESTGQDWKSLGEGNDTYKFRIPRLSFYGSGSVIFDVIRRLLQGSTLNEVCREIKIPTPSAEYGNLHLSATPQTIASSFVVKPVVFLETVSSVRILKPSLQSPSSPSEQSPAFSSSIFLLDKESLFYSAEQELLPQSDKLIKACLTYLSKETGLDFRGADSRRLGNIEWLLLTATDENENPRVEFRSTRNCIPPDNTDESTKELAKAASVEIRSGVLPVGTQVLVRCRLRNGDEIILDQCMEAEINEETLSLCFEAKCVISEIHITIWKREVKSKSWEIWFEDRAPLVGEIHTQTGVSSLEGRLRTKLLAEASNSREVIQKRVRGAETVRRTQFRSSTIGEYQSDPWVTPGRNIHEAARYLFPKQSGGGFFPKGWENREPGLLSFVEWFKATTKIVEEEHVVIIDPYFDENGVELLSLVESTDVEYAVLTNTQVKSEDDVTSITESNGSTGTTLTDGPSRDDRIKTKCAELEPLLLGLNLRILDLRSIGGGDTRLFHDRYIIILDKPGRVVKGYNLSNSIQGATKKAPLLVTPIPSDLLNPVAEYVKALLEARPPTINDAKIEILYDSKEANRRRREKRHPELTENPHMGFFFSVLLQDSTLVSLDSPGLKRRLVDEGFLTEDDNVLLPEADESKLEYLTRKLLQSSEDDFAKLWIAFSEWLDHISEPDRYLEEVENYGGSQLAEKNKTYLSQPSKQNHTPRPFTYNEAREVGIGGSLINLDFKQGLDDAWKLLNFMIPLEDLRGASFKYGTRYLCYFFPTLLTAGVKEITARLSYSQDRTETLRISYNLGVILAEIRHHMSNLGATELLNAMLKTEVPFLRAIGTASIVKHLSENPSFDPQEFIDTLEVLPKYDYLYALAELILRLNKPGAHDNKERMQPILDRIKELWPSDITREYFSSILTHLSGPGGSGWAISTLQNLLGPLMNDNRMSINQVAELWLGILIKRLEERNQFFPKSDQELTEAAGWVLANINEDQRNSWLERFKKIEKQALSVLWRPFARSRSDSHDLWVNSIETLLWLKVLLDHTQLNSADSSGISESSLKGLEEWSSKLDLELAKIDDLQDITRISGLWYFATGTKRLLEGQRK